MPQQPSDFEQALARLELIVQRLEDGELGLAESLSDYEEGVKLLKQCGALLERAERRIELVSSVDAQGNPVTEPMDVEATLSHEETASYSGTKRPPRSRPRKKSATPGGKTPPEASQADVDEPKGLF